MSNEMPKDIAAELRVRAAIEQVKGSLFERAADEIERLCAELVSTTNKLTAERDEARRGLCYEVAAWVADFKHSTHGAESRAEAERRGWDCFKEDSDDR